MCKAFISFGESCSSSLGHMLFSGSNPKKQRSQGKVPKSTVFSIFIVPLHSIQSFSPLFLIPVFIFFVVLPMTPITDSVDGAAIFFYVVGFSMKWIAAVVALTA